MWNVNLFIYIITSDTAYSHLLGRFVTITDNIIVTTETGKYNDIYKGNNFLSSFLKTPMGAKRSI